MRCTGAAASSATPKHLQGHGGGVKACRSAYGTLSFRIFIATCPRRQRSTATRRIRRDPQAPSGKLRLLYEAGPLAFVAEQAGGYASGRQGPILDVTPTSPPPADPPLHRGTGISSARSRSSSAVSTADTPGRGAPRAFPGIENVIFLSLEVPSCRPAAVRSSRPVRSRWPPWGSVPFPRPKPRPAHRKSSRTSSRIEPLGPDDYTPAPRESREASGRTRPRRPVRRRRHESPLLHQGRLVAERTRLRRRPQP